MRDSCGRSRDGVMLARVAFLIHCLLQLFLRLVVEFVVLARGARQLAARARKLAGQHPFPWGWPCLFLEAQSRLQFWDEGKTTIGQNCSNPRSLQAMFHRIPPVRERRAKQLRMMP